MQNAEEKNAEPAHSLAPLPSASAHTVKSPPIKEIGGPEGPEPTRFGDWEKNGRCIDF